MRGTLGGAGMALMTIGHAANLLRKEHPMADKENNTALGSIEFDEEYLKVPLVVVLGHDSCGAVTAIQAAPSLPESAAASAGGAVAPRTAAPHRGHTTVKVPDVGRGCCPVGAAPVRRGSCWCRCGLGVFSTRYRQPCGSHCHQKTPFNP